MKLLRDFLVCVWAMMPGGLAACDLALVLAVDVSGSVDAGEYRIQMGGLAEALRDPVVSEALVRARARVLLMQWSGASRQQTTIDWTTVDSFAASDRLADRVEENPRVWRNFSTAVGEALQHGLAAFDTAGPCARRLIDVSGDGVSNEGIAPGEVHPALRAAGVTVNAIAIEASEPDLTAYFYENVITGEGAFVVTAQRFEDYPDRIRRKLLREVTQATASLVENGGVRAPVTGAPRSD
ncbi:DUF1194 domain-containing protein [Seohaeicola saemankumensis]|nr:DUF1194 domain-containing protein [Seohaeicola saemankumensis]MCA0871009.1 DUF1194 domain-containing protein [Seohaeicola saemankumensis]